MKSIFSNRAVRSGLAAFVTAAALAVAAPAFAASEEGHGTPRQHWTFAGITGHFDKPQLRRGYMVYKNVCAACHGMRLLYYRNLSEPGGPMFSPENVVAFAGEAQVTDGPDDNGDMFQRPGKPTDRFVSPYANAKAAAAAQNGAVPPDLSLIVKARTVEAHSAWYMDPFRWGSDVLTSYQEQGADYLFALLMGYSEAPAGVQLAPGMNYNAAFPGHQIAMPQPLSDGLVTYDDGTPATLENYARDVTAFLAWAAEPTLEERKRMGLKVLVFLIVMTALLYLSKRILWRNVEH
jgi:ubiquinol-cytochrome c reductase cytochrome c1 subunit